MARTLTPYVVSVPRKRSAALTPEIVDPRLADVEAVARWLDYAFELPGGFRFGLAGFIGLIPGIGDVVDAIVSMYIVTRAIQLGAPRVTLARMLVNVSIETIVGSIPFLGDMFDIAFKANKRNYELLRSQLAHPRRQHAQDWLFLIATLLLVSAGIVLPILALIKIAKYL